MKSIRTQDAVGHALIHDLVRIVIGEVKDTPFRRGHVITEEDIPKLSHYADKEANPLYPVPVLMDAGELEKFYYMLMPDKEQPET